MSPSRELVPVPRPGGGRRGWRGWRGWRPRLDAAARLLCRVARSPLARRLALAMLLAAAAAGIVGLSYATADAQAVPARPAPAARAAGERATGPAPAPDDGGAPRRATGTPRGPAASGAAGGGGGGGAGRGGVRAGPGAVAVAWYAARLGLPAGRVHALATQPTGHPRPGVRVLLLADRGHGQLATAWIHLHHTPTGWTVTP